MHPQLADVVTALKIIYKYNPDNDGSIVPRAGLGNTQMMKEDLLHLSALGPRLAAVGAMFDACKDVVENERRLARSRAWKRIRAWYRQNEPTTRVTNDLLEHEANASVEKHYTLQSDVMMAGKILSWVRTSVRDFDRTLQILLQTAVKENIADAQLQ
ncbi:MAG: hypothetical protein GTO63_34275 [Anaerolineae bacterium]|nr:hypothetical protein [Anaerolineae bacterium]NIN99707.1 hypothetical protein [Anaerolineae bacterium]NIQ82559.1 hypothetical protein [Anaerolineae bacterium]